MDKPRHPLVIRPWKLQRTERNKWKVPLLKASGSRYDPQPVQKSSEGRMPRKDSAKRS